MSSRRACSSVLHRGSSPLGGYRTCRQPNPRSGHDAQASATTQLLSLPSAATTAAFSPMVSSPRSPPRPAALNHRSHLAHSLSMQLANAHRSSALVAAHSPPFPCTPDQRRSALFVVRKASRHSTPAQAILNKIAAQNRLCETRRTRAAAQRTAHEGTVRHGDRSAARLQPAAHRILPGIQRAHTIQQVGFYT